ncbi:MAG: tetratricopeptide repeat protein [Gemmatimonadetes bacterium]|nr:tetratricopeptide repeat protein [Gemmatimonadota bacterium]
MATPFLSSEEYDERAHRLYNDGDYEGALHTLKEGLHLYPDSVELLVGLGYTRLAREEFVWAKQAFEKALLLEADDHDGLVGLGEVLLRFGRHPEAQRLFARVRAAAPDDLDLFLSMGRALYRERLFSQARALFDEAVLRHPTSPEAAAALGYTLHRLGEDVAARRHLRRALKLDPTHHEARIYLAHLLYDRGDWRAALQEYERVPAAEHWEAVAVWRTLELKRAILGLEAGDPGLGEWEARLRELEAEADPLDELLADLENAAREAPRREPPRLGRRRREPGARHRVRLPDGRVYAGTWLDIVKQLRDANGRPGESLAQFMHRQAAEQRSRVGALIPSHDPEAFLRASARAGLLSIEPVSR